VLKDLYEIIKNLIAYHVAEWFEEKDIGYYGLLRVDTDRGKQEVIYIPNKLPTDRKKLEKMAERKDRYEVKHGSSFRYFVSELTQDEINRNINKTY
jgi:hypothetical protein